MPTASSLAWKPRKEVGTLWPGELRSVALYLWIDRGIRQAIDRCSNIWASLPGAGYGQFEHKADNWLIQRSGRNGQRLMYEQSHHDYVPLWDYLLIVCLSWAVSHYRDNAITYKAQRDKNAARELKLVQQLLTCRCVAWVFAALDAKYTKELADAKAENDVLCVMMMLPLVVVSCTSKQSVSQCVKPPPPPAWIMQPPPTGRHRWTGLFHPQREADHYAKTTGRNPIILFRHLDRVAHIDGQLMQLLWAIHALARCKCLK